jgi:hypothetical protein
MLQCFVQHIVAVKDEPLASKSSKLDGRSRATSKHLPLGCHDGNVWRRSFIPTYINYIANCADPWTVPDAEALAAMRKIWKRVYGSKLDHMIEIGDAVFKTVTHAISIIESSDCCEFRQHNVFMNGAVVSALRQQVYSAISSSLKAMLTNSTPMKVESNSVSS